MPLALVTSEGAVRLQYQTAHSKAVAVASDIAVMCESRVLSDGSILCTILMTVLPVAVF